MAASTAVQDFEKAIKRIRDILRTIGITGKESMDILVLYTLARNIDEETATLYNIPNGFTWENLMHTNVADANSMLISLERFDSSEGECLITYLDQIFGVGAFGFPIRDPHRHCEIMEQLDPIKIKEVNMEIDTLGWIYEQLLSTGASAARDLGQFFTPRKICNFMVRMCAPEFKSSGVPENICDPTMGTGGFLSSYIRFFEEYYPDTPVDWKVQNKNIYGYDVDAKIAAISKVNMFMETGYVTENLDHRDSLRYDVGRHEFDIILANMPFGVKGLKHAECCDAVKDLKIRGTKSEPLFLQLIMARLAPGGRCAVVVPDGMINCISNLHANTRKHLLKNFELQHVITLTGKVFVNTNVKTYILYFENNGYCTGDINFWELDCEKDILETDLIDTINVKELNDKCTLDINRYKKKVANTLNDVGGYPKVRIGDVCKIEGGKFIAKKDGVVEGFPIYGGGRKGSYCSPTSNRKDRMTIARTGVSENCVSWVEGEFYLNDHGWTLDFNETTSEKFMYYYLKFTQQQVYELARGAAQKGITQEDFFNLEVTIPPLEIQDEIIKSLERIYVGHITMDETLKLTSHAMDLMLMDPSGSLLREIISFQETKYHYDELIKSRTVQMSNIMKSTIRRDFPEVSLRELSSINTSNIKKEERIQEIDYIDLGSVSRGVILGRKHMSIEDAPTAAKRHVSNNDILWGTVRPLSRSYAYAQNVNNNTIVSSAFAVVTCTSPNIIPKYMYYFITSEYCVAILSLRSKGAQYPKFNVDDLNELMVNVPPLAYQERVVQILDQYSGEIEAAKMGIARITEDSAFIMESYFPPEE